MPTSFFLMICIALSQLLAFPITAKPNSISFIQCPWELDGRVWSAYNFSNHEKHGVVRYFPAGQGIKDWSELVTMQWFEESAVAPLSYYSAFVEGLRKTFPAQQINHQILHGGEMSLLAEWESSAEQKATSYGVIRVFSCFPHIYLLTYLCRDPSKFEQAKKTWRAICGQANLNFNAIDRLTLPK